MRVLILHDTLGPDAGSEDLDVLTQASVVATALAELGHEPHVASAGFELNQLVEILADPRPDLVFNLVESMAGHGSLIHVVPALLDALRIPYTGCPAEAIHSTSNKVAAKRWLRTHNVPTPTWYTLQELDVSLPVGFVSGTYIIKSVWEHASAWLDDNAIVRAEEPADLRRALLAKNHGVASNPRRADAWFAERFVEGRELNVSMLARTDGTAETLPHAEILFEGFASDQPRVVGYRAKWDPHSFEYNHTPRSFVFGTDDIGLLDRLTKLCEHCWLLFGLGGYARLDFRVDREGNPWLLEANTNPCLAPDAGFVAALGEAGISICEAVHRILSAALGRPPWASEPVTPHRTTAANAAIISSGAR